MKRKPQTFSRVVKGRLERLYDPTTPDNRNRPKSDFYGLIAYESEFQRYQRTATNRRRFALTVTLMVIWVAAVILVQVFS
jgi:hypothetical protein